MLTSLLFVMTVVLAFWAGFCVARRPTLVRDLVSMVVNAAGRARRAISRQLHAAREKGRLVDKAGRKQLSFRDGAREGALEEIVRRLCVLIVVVVHRVRVARQAPREPVIVAFFERDPHGDLLFAPLDARTSDASAAPTSTLLPILEPRTPELPFGVVAANGVDDSSPPRPLATTDLPSVRFDPVVSRGTQSAELALHSPEWKEQMAAVGERFAAADVCAIVFVHGTFMGSDPLSAYGVVERALPGGIGPYVAMKLRRKTRAYIERVLGDLGNFSTAYVRLFEEALRPRGARIPCTEFVWSSENHHVGRLEGALGLVRVLATHAELGDREKPRRILVIGHSHAGQLFALVTQLLARSIATEAILDVARARELDVAALETDIATLVGSSFDRGSRRGKRVNIDFVTFGAPIRYAWATVPGVRALHVIAVPPRGSRSGLEGDWIRRIAVEGSDFPPLSGEERRINAALADTLGHAGFDPTRLANALRSEVGLPSYGEVAFVEYGDKSFLASGLGHGSYTRLDAMLFHGRLIAERMYSAPLAVPGDASLFSTRAWSTVRALAPLGRVFEPTEAVASRASSTRVRPSP